MTEGHVAAVTGASRGIGRATALALAREGYTVYALARTLSDLNSLRQAVPDRIIPVELDIADDSSREAAIESIMRDTQGRGVDVLVNNAGYGQLGPVEEVPIDRLRRQFETNVVGLIAFTQPFLPGMRERGYGRVVNISSAAGRIATPFMGPYSASKFAVEALSDSMRVELARFGVKVVLIEPGPIETDFGHAADRPHTLDSPYARSISNWNSTHGRTNLFERSPESVARTIVRAIKRENPRARYTVTVSAKAATVARRIVPDRLIDWALRRAVAR